MRSLTCTQLLYAIALFFGLSQAVPASEDESISEAVALSRRAWKRPPDPPSTDASYAPKIGQCGNGTDLLTTIPSNSLPELEADYITKRKTSADTALLKFLGQYNVTNHTLSNLVGENGPRVGIAVSGGGFRSLFFAGGALEAMDARTPNSSLGGLLQSSTYLTGLDGGAWLVGSLAVNNFRTVQNLSESAWYSRLGIFYIVDTHVGDNENYYTNVCNEVDQKSAAGFNISMTDYWGRALARRVTGMLRGGPNTTFSSVQNAAWFKNASFPYPVMVAEGLSSNLPKFHNGTQYNSSVYEISPYYFGTFDNGVRAVMPTYYLGTNLTNGSATNGQCVTLYDNLGFLMGTTSTRFNEALLGVSMMESRMSRRLGHALRRMRVNGTHLSYYPNFVKDSSAAEDTTGASTNLSSATYLNLYDGGSDGQNIPVWPLLQPERGVDVVFALDSSSDTLTYWPNGTALVKTYERITKRSNVSAAGDYSVKHFPYIPSVNTFINLGLNNKPTFFGCDGRNTTRGNVSVDANTPPVIVYMPNAPWTMMSNTADDRYRYGQGSIRELVENGRGAASLGGSSEFAQCVACAVIQRSLERRNMSASAKCQQCFQEYCWNGTLDDRLLANTKARVDYQPFVRSGASATTKITLSTLLLSLISYYFVF
ncbi:phospholipase [Schizosaccharomyces japonicus yFS275]|uniref:Lysophospholipase n=1 Tax=Schizosaccharomyces japonicus (strain yFS275 / FY16936) TaxID=402676 RepID=B6K3L5_SCHJY|nr:phospholipase [Schizosaccharomyces japonicus yFS275]EEB08072.1 phospholipase [Schizosaccharomyces japonicus yFS275]